MSSPLTHTRFSELIKKTAKSLDYYNSGDLSVSTETTDQNTSGEIIGIAINNALHQIYDLIKDSRYLEAFPTTKLSTEAGKDWVDLDPEAFLDEIESIADTSNNIKLTKKSWNWYRRNYPDPSDATGNPIFYIRRDTRLYLAPQPSSVIPLTIDFRKFTGDLKLGGDLPLLPTHYDYWIMAEAKVKFYETLDALEIPPFIVSERNEARATAMGSIFSDYDSSLQAGSNFGRRSERVGAFDRL